MSDPVTTVVVTRNRAAALRATLPRHTGPVIVVDNGSTDGTVAQVRRDHPEVQVIALPDNRGAVGRNAGVEAARTPYVAFADDDSWWEPGALDIAATYFDVCDRLGLIAARVLVGEADELDPVSALMARSPLPGRADLPGRSVLGFLACGAVVRRTAFLEAGGFDAVVEFGGEEERLALDLAASGWGLAYLPVVVAHHHPAAARPDRTAAQARLARNSLLTAVMRRPWSVVAGTVPRLLADRPAGPRGVAAALPRLPRAWQHRRVLDPEVERLRRLLDP